MNVKQPELRTQQKLQEGKSHFSISIVQIFLPAQGHMEQKNQLSAVSLVVERSAMKKEPEALSQSPHVQHGNKVYF